MMYCITLHEREDFWRSNPSHFTNLSTTKVERFFGFKTTMIRVKFLDNQLLIM